VSYLETDHFLTRLLPDKWVWVKINPDGGSQLHRLFFVIPIFHFHIAWHMSHKSPPAGEWTGKNKGAVRVCFDSLSDMGG
jgi:hypothetical protein